MVKLTIGQRRPGFRLSLAPTGRGFFQRLIGEASVKVRRRRNRTVARSPPSGYSPRILPSLATAACSLLVRES